MKNNSVSVVTDVISAIQSISKKQIIMYAWGCKNTWFITKDKKQVMPKGSRLLAILNCTTTKDQIKTKFTYPAIGDVVSDSNGHRLLIEDCRFI